MEVVKIGQTIDHGGEVDLVINGELPVDCMVLFVSMDTWEEIKSDVEVTNG